MFWGVLTPKLYFLSLRPQRGTSLRRNTHFEPLFVVIGPTVWSGRDTKSTKKKEPKVSQNSPFSQTPLPSSHINQILRAGSYPGYLSWFWISERSFEKCGSSGGVEFLAFPLTWHIAYTTACCYRTCKMSLLHASICIKHHEWLRSSAGIKTAQRCKIFSKSADLSTNSWTCFASGCPEQHHVLWYLTVFALEKPEGTHKSAYLNQANVYKIAI